MKDILGLLVLSLPLVLLALIVLAVLVAVTLAIRYARKSGRNRWAWGIGVFLLIFLPIFWDWVPTVLMHKYHCSTEAGFWVYKTMDQWKAENPGVMETLVDNSPQKYSNWPRESWNGKEITSINQRFGLQYKNHLYSSTKPNEKELFLNVWRWETEVIDKKTAFVLAQRVDFSSGNDGYIGGEGPLKFWLVNKGCNQSREYSNAFRGFLEKLRGMKQ